ncbi:MAG: hypothetical protein ACLUSL_05710 [Ruminococcus sp.]
MIKSGIDDSKKIFLVQQFFEKMLPRSGREAWSLSADSEISTPMLLAHGEKGEKIDRFSRESEHDRFPWLPLLYW